MALSLCPSLSIHPVRLIVYLSRWLTNPEQAWPLILVLLILVLLILVLLILVLLILVLLILLINSLLSTATTENKRSRRERNCTRACPSNINQHEMREKATRSFGLCKYRKGWGM
jgi:predicted membrane protein